MIVLFAHDHRFIRAENAVWSESQFDAALWARYLRHFDSLTVAARHGAMPSGGTVAMLERSSAIGVSFELFPNLSSVRGLTFDRPAAWRRMRELVLAHDAVIARLPSEIGLLAIAAARTAGKPWAVEVAGCPWDALWQYGRHSARLYAPIAWTRMRLTVRRADHALYVTRDFLQRRYPCNASNIAAASNVVLTETSHDVLESRLARIARVGTGPLRLGLIGTLRGRYKGIQILLAALAQARAELPALSLRILGAGNVAPWQDAAGRLGVDDLVFFDGTLPAGDPVLHWLDQIDVYLQPSLQEGLPRALIEAMSRGCPALASTVAGIPELLPSEDLVRPGDSRALASLLARRSTDRRWMAARARANWSRARDYRAEVLDVRREEFFLRFRSAAERENYRA